MEPLNEKSQIAQEYGLLPADAWQQRGLELTEKAGMSEDWDLENQALN